MLVVLIYSDFVVWYGMALLSDLGIHTRRM